MGINFNDTTQPAALEVCAGEQKFKVSITAPVGELLQPHTMSEGDFSNQQSECPAVVVTWYIMPSQLQSCQSKANFAKSQGKVIHCSLWASLFEGLRRIGKNAVE